MKTWEEGIHSFHGKNILVIGDLMLDEYLWGEASRISPEAPVPVIEIRNKTYALGGAGNVAANIQSLGGIPFMGGVIGDDPSGETLQSLLTSLQGSEHNKILKDMNRPTTLKSRLLAQSQQIVRMDRESRIPIGPSMEYSLFDWVETQFPLFHACVLSDYGKGVITPRLAQAVIQKAQQNNIPVIVDPIGSHYFKYKNATIVKPNIHEVERLLKEEVQNEGHLHQLGNQLIELLEGSSVLITRGSEGMVLFQKGNPVFHVPALARQVFDVTGAGDTVIATLSLALASHFPLKEAVQIANQAASIVVGKKGTSTVTQTELIQSGQQFEE